MGGSGEGTVLKAILLDRYLTNPGQKTGLSLMIDSNEAALKAVFRKNPKPVSGDFFEVPALKFKGYDFQTEFWEGAVHIQMVKQAEPGLPQWLNRAEVLEAPEGSRLQKAFRRFLTNAKNNP